MEHLIQLYQTRPKFITQHCICHTALMATCSGTEVKTRKILVAVDGGEESLYALLWALDNVVSNNFKDTLILLYAKLPRIMYTALDETGFLFSSETIARMERHNHDLAESVMENCKRLCKNFQHVKVETKVEDGDPRDVICEAAEKLRVDVLVMGTHGYGLIKRAFLGSVSSHCSQKVKCPVLIVKRPKTSAAA